MSKYTPGPWELTTKIGTDRLTVIKQAGWSVIIGETDGCLQAEANARLIAAAPDLLKELRLMVIQHCGQLDEPRNPNCLVCLPARAVIAKAEGEEA